MLHIWSVWSLPKPTLKTIIIRWCTSYDDLNRANLLWWGSRQGRTRAKPFCLSSPPSFRSTSRTFTFPNFLQLQFSNFPNFLTRSQLSFQIGEWASHAAAHPWSQLSLSDFRQLHILTFVRFLSNFNFVRFLPSFRFVRFLSDFNFVRLHLLPSLPFLSLSLL